MTSIAPLALRLASDADGRTIDRLAALDDASTPDRPALIAEVGGKPVAALSLRDGHVVADPFRRSADVVAVMRVAARRAA